jgi:hypothetical protein
MASHSSAARTNLTSNNVRIGNHKLGEGQFRICLRGEFIGGNRNNQAAACKRFKPDYRYMEREFFAKDFEIIDRTIRSAEEWNEFCEYGKEILVSKGAIHFPVERIQSSTHIKTRHTSPNLLHRNPNVSDRVKRPLQNLKRLENKVIILFSTYNCNSK